jgi:hypothetical protein
MRRGLWTFVFAAVLAAAGCTGELIPIEPGPGPDPDPTPGVDAGGGEDPLARAYFDSNVQPLFVLARPLGTCVSCHQTDTLDTALPGPLFLGANTAANYDALMINPRVVSTDPATSLLVTRGLHDGDAFQAGEISTINEWILMEAGQ